MDLRPSLPSVAPIRQPTGLRKKPRRSIALNFRHRAYAIPRAVVAFGRCGAVGRQRGRSGNARLRKGHSIRDQESAFRFRTTGDHGVVVGAWRPVSISTDLARWHRVRVNRQCVTVAVSSLVVCCLGACNPAHFGPVVRCI